MTKNHLVQPSFLLLRYDGASFPIRSHPGTSAHTSWRQSPAIVYRGFTVHQEGPPQRARAVQHEAASPAAISSIVNIHNPSIEVHPVDPAINTGAVVILAAGRRAQHPERRHRRRGLRSVLLQLRREHRHPAQPSAPGRLQSADRCGQRCAAGHPHGARAREGMEHRSEQDRHHGIFGRRRTRGAGRDRVFETFDKANNDGRRSAGGDQFAAGLRRSGLSGPDAVRARRQPADSRATRRRRSSSAPAPAMPQHAVWADRVFRRHVSRRAFPNLEMHIYGNGRIPATAMTAADGSQRHAVRHLAGPLHRLVPRSGLSRKPGVETKAARTSPRGWPVARDEQRHTILIVGRICGRGSWSRFDIACSGESIV